MKKIFTAIIFFILCFSLNKNVLAQDENIGDVKEETLEGNITEIIDEESFEIEGVTQYYQKIRFLVTKGSLVGRTVEIENGSSQHSSNQRFAVGDNLMVVYTKDLSGNDIFFINDYIRRDGLLILFITFSALVILIGRLWGAASILGMVMTFLVIFKFILPQILVGKDPVLIAILGSAVIVPFTFSLSHGFKFKTLIAGIGTLITLVVVGLLASFTVNAIHLTGFSAEESSYLQFELENILNMKGILLAGIIIATLGILDDITISQASVVQELKEANKNYKFKKLFNCAMNVGRDHIASLVNTLVLVYAGASLPLFLLFMNNSIPLSEVINYEMIAEEVVRTLVGSIGLVLAVPITTFIAAYYFQKK